MGLSEIRKELDEIDRSLLHLFEKRMQLALEVAKDKEKTGKAVFDGKREAEKLDSVSALVSDGDLKTPVRELFNGLMTLSRRRQLEYLATKGRRGKFGFTEVPTLSFRGKKLLVQGVRWSYSYLAGRTLFPDEAISFAEHFQDVVEAIMEGKTDYGILPIDNSTYGMVQDNYDLLHEYTELTVLREIFYPVSHCLAAEKVENEEALRKVYSHPQALSQCREFFLKHPKVEKVSALNTAIAAKMLSESQEEGAAVLCSREAAEYYHLSILEDRVSSKENTTRFFLLGREKEYTKEAYKLSLTLRIPNTVGSLYHVLENFLWNDLSLSMIQSRPLGDGAFSYLFFIDVLGNLSDAKMENALSSLQELGVEYRILGNYPPFTEERGGEKE